jgi:protein involved in polysaccharide export with SLBB domain
MRKIYLSLSLLLLSLTLLPAQAVPEQLRQQARQEIQKRGLDEQEVRQRLLARGIDIDNMNVEQLQAAQPQIEAVIQELEAEKMSKPTSSASRDTSPTATNDQQALEKIATDFGPEEAQDIREKIDQGATVQETISEELQEKAKENDLDPPTRIYGQEIFRNKTLEIYRASRDIKPPNSYILGAGDVINISIFGTSQADLQFEIDPDGFIRPSNMPRVYLKGVNYGQAKELLRQRFRQAYRFRPEQFAVSINAARTMTINIFGEVENQGSFTLSAINTAFNALVAAGGPTDIGSVRNIRLMRGGEERYLDVYAFMQDPALQYEFYLEDNDILFVPIAERVVSIQGAVNRPLRYELIEGEELMSLINFAGGLQANAYTDLIQIRRFTDNEELLIDVSLQELLDNKEDFLLRNGDQVLIKRIPEAAENRVSISGAVQLPGDYALIEGLRVSDLLRRGVLQEEAKLDVAFLFRRQLDNSLELVQLNLEAILNNPGQGQDLLLRKRDRLLVFTQERYVDTYEVSISGAVRKPMQQEYEPALRISDLLYLAGGLSPQATDFAYLLRKDPAQPNDVEYIRIDLSAILADSTSVENRLLQPLDELRVLNRNTYVDQATVRVSGAVRNPGEFPYDSTLSIENALTLAGGLELQAASNRIDIFRLQIDENQPTRTLMETITINKDGLLSGDAGTNFALAPFDQIVVRAVPEFEFQQSVQLEGEVLYPGTYALLNDNERLSDLIERAGGLTPEAYLQGAVLNRSENGIGIVVIELDKALSQTGSRADLVLKQGDVLTIPKPQEVVSIRVLGTEANELYSSELIQNGRINIAYQGNKSAKWYIKNYASGFDKRARRSSTSVEYPSGRIDGTDNFLFVKNYPTVKPGSEIRLVLKEPKAEREDREPVDWGKVASDVLTSATAALTFILLIQRI